MATTAAASVNFPPFFTPKIPHLCSSSIASTFQKTPPKLAVASGFIRKVVAISTQQVETLEEEPSFSPEYKLFVGNLPFSVDSAQLAALFQQAGAVEMVEVILDKTTGRSRGFAFVTMSTVEEAEVAAQQFNGYELHGRSLRVNYGPAPPTREKSPFRRSREWTSSDSTNKVYVGNLSWEIDNHTLENLFNEQGKVREARVVCERNGRKSRGFGFVTYSSPEEVNNAVESLNGTDVNGRTIRVSPVDDRAQRQL